MKLPECWRNNLAPIADHYAHQSIKDPGKVAYTKPPQHGFEDRQTTVPPGESLKGILPSLSNEAITMYAAMMSADSVTLKYTITGDEIVSVYTTSEAPTSCMDGDHGFRSGDPSRASGDSDLRLAYIGTLAKKIDARGLVWPAKKRYTGRTAIRS